MLDYLYILIILPAAVYAASYAKTLRQDRNSVGAAFAWFIVALSLGLPVYRMVSSP